jgi:hypothetical protein
LRLVSEAEVGITQASFHAIVAMERTTLITTTAKRKCASRLRWLELWTAAAVAAVEVEVEVAFAWAQKSRHVSEGELGITQAVFLAIAATVRLTLTTTMEKRR